MSAVVPRLVVHVGLLATTLRWRWSPSGTAGRTSNESPVTVTYEARAETNVARPVAKLAELFDRFFFLVWIGFYLLLPVSGWADVMFRSWFDQRRDLEALRSVIAHGHAQTIADNGIGPAYIALAALVHDVLGVSPENALILLTRGSYVLAVAGGVLLVRALVRGLVGAPALVSVASQFAFMALVFSAGTWHWSDVPWSHFLAAFLAVGLYAARFLPGRPTILSAALAGVALSLLWLTRSFELLAVLLAWGITAATFALLRLHRERMLRLAHLLTGAATFAATTAVVYAVTGKRDLFFLYGGSLGSQSGNVDSSHVASTPTLSLSLLPQKLVQLFVDPCYDSLCSVSDYSGRASASPLLTQGAGNLRLWSLPLSIQLPSLVLLPLCLVAVVVLVLRAARRRDVWAERTPQLRLLAELTLAATGLVVGYAASTLTGPAHLRYGFARDFLLPALLSGIAGVALISAGLWVALSRRRSGRLSPEFGFVVLALVGSMAMVAVTAYARPHGLPRINSAHLAAVEYTASCSGGTCTVSMDARTPSGAVRSIPRSSILTFGCGSAKPRLTIYATDPSRGVGVGACSDPRLVAAWPTVMGLPPGEFELRAVKVRNASL
jgi:hypothetical protein